MQVQSGSGIYFAFIAAVFFIYWASAGSRLVRLGVILLANYLFCARFGLFYILILPVCSSLDFLIGLGLMRSSRPRIRTLLVALSVTMNLAVLVASRHMGLLLNRHLWDWIFPLGLSFYTFQSLTYTIDLYRRDGEGTTSLLAYLSAVTFFPTLQAGPITRVTELVKQFSARSAAGPRGWRTGVLSDRPGPREEGSDCRLPGGEPGEPRLRHPQALQRLRGADRGLRLLPAALLRLFRLHRYRPRLGDAAGDPAADELRSAVRIRQHDRVLAALAHHLLQLAARLPLFLAAGSAVQDHAVCQPGHYHAAGRLVARRHLDLRHLGPAARHGAGRDPRLVRPARAGPSGR